MKNYYLFRPETKEVKIYEDLDVMGKAARSMVLGRHNDKVYMHDPQDILSRQWGFMYLDKDKEVTQLWDNFLRHHKIPLEFQAALLLLKE